MPVKFRIGVAGMVVALVQLISVNAHSREVSSASAPSQADGRITAVRSLTLCQNMEYHGGTSLGRIHTKPINSSRLRKGETMEKVKQYN